MSNSDLCEAMAIVVKAVNFIVGRSALTHRQFQSLLKEKDCSYKDIPLVMENFVGCFDAITAFLAEKGQNYPELEDEKCVGKVLFLAGISGQSFRNFKSMDQSLLPWSNSTAIMDVSWIYLWVTGWIHRRWCSWLSWGVHCWVAKFYISTGEVKAASGKLHWLCWLSSNQHISVSRYSHTWRAQQMKAGPRITLTGRHLFICSAHDFALWNTLSQSILFSVVGVFIR